MRKLLISATFAVFTGAAIMGCDTSTPNSASQKTALKDEAQATITRMEAQDSTLADRINNAYGYAVFPEVGQAAVGIGGSSGKGIVYKGGQRVGHVTLSQASLGPQVGGDTFAELIIFQDEHALNRLMNNSIEFGADANATFVKAGAAGAANFANGVQVYVMPKGGLMAGAAINGQKFHYSDWNAQGSETTTTTTVQQQQNP